MKFPIVCFLLLASLTAACAADEGPSAAATAAAAQPPILAAKASAEPGSVPSAGIAPAASVSTTSLPTRTADDIQPAIPLTAPMPINALPAAPSAVVILKKKPETHRFLDHINTLGFSLMAAGLSADALSTQRGLSLPGFYEMNPMARPFVQTRAGAAAYSVGSFGLLTGAMYVAHKTGHHRLERILPFATAGWEGLLSFRNYHVIAQHTK